jgi:hypothetical protein
MIGALSGDKAAWAVSPNQRRQDGIASKKHATGACVIGWSHQPRS